MSKNRKYSHSSNIPNANLASSARELHSANLAIANYDREVESAEAAVLEAISERTDEQLADDGISITHTLRTVTSRRDLFRTLKRGVTRLEHELLGEHDFHALDSLNITISRPDEGEDMDGVQVFFEVTRVGARKAARSNDG